MASLKGVALVFLLLLALELTSIPSSSAQNEKKEKQCSKVGAHLHCEDTWEKAAKGKELGKGDQGCCKYLKQFDVSEAASCLCNVVSNKEKEKDNLADTVITVLKACEIHYPVPTTYKCSKD